MWMLLLFACSQTAVPADPLAYVEAARLASTDAAAAAERCRASGPRYADECLAQAAFEAPGSSGEALCEAIVDAFWRDECWFLVAEAAVTRGETERAVERCSAAGRYQDNCVTHLWRLHAATLLRLHPPAEAAGRYAEAIRWAPDDMQAGTEDRFWNKFYEGALSEDDTPALDLAWCDDFPAELVSACRRQLPGALKRALTRVERERAQGGQALPVGACDAQASLQARVEAGYGLRYVPSPRLDRVAERHLSRRCERPARR